MTIATIAVGAIAILLIVAQLSYLLLSLQTSTVRRSGHLNIFTQGFYQFGGGNPSAYAINDYRDVMDLIRRDQALAPKIAVVTAFQSAFGVASNYSAERSKTFFGEGVIWRDRDLMKRWNEYRFDAFERPDPPLADPDGTVGIVGVGVARILGLCVKGVSNCEHSAIPAPPPAAEAPVDAPRRDFTGLIGLDRPEGAHPASVQPQLDLLAATADGAPNVVTLRIGRAEGQGNKDLDDNFVIMSLPLAQKLLYGREQPKVTGIVIQLRRTQDLRFAKSELNSLFQKHHLPLEVKDYKDLTPLYGQAVRFFSFLFAFISTVISVIALFTIVNTMTMAIMERTSEVGTLRALGFQRAEINRQFLAEGCILGIAGATFGVLGAIALATAVNHTGLRWTPPTASGDVPFRLYLFGTPWKIAATWFGLIVVAAFAASVPARRAARMVVVEALRHA